MDEARRSARESRTGRKGIATGALAEAVIKIRPGARHCHGARAKSRPGTIRLVQMVQAIRQRAGT